MAPVLLVILVGLLIGPASCQNMTLMSGQVINLTELYKAADYKCCIPGDFLGDYTPIVRMDGSNGQFYVTGDPQCKDTSQIVPSASYPATYKAIWACGKCKGDKCAVDGGLQLALPDDWCVDSQNKLDPSVICSTAAAICDAGYSGKCIAVPSENTKAISSGPSITLQSGLVVDLNQLAQQYQGQCCLPRSVINDNSALVRIDNSDGKFFVSMDPSCSTPLTSDVYPVMFEYISVGCSGSSSSSASSGSTYVINGGPTLIAYGANTCDPYNYYSGGCWGQSPICSFANVCIGIPYYDYNVWDDGWDYYRPRWWLPLLRPFRPGWAVPPVFPRPGPILPIRPPPPGWRPGQQLPGWLPGHRPPGWRPVSPLRPPNDKPWPSIKPAQPIFKAPGQSGQGPASKPSGRPAGPGHVLPSRPGGAGGSSKPSGGQQPSWVIRPAAPRPSQPTTRPSQPTTRPTQPTTRPSQPTTRPSQPTTRPSQPTTRPSQPTTRPSQPTMRPSQPTTRPSHTLPSTPSFSRPGGGPATRPYIPQTSMPAGGGLTGGRTRGGGRRG